jgi:DNA-nicking Smr family endonuclease
MDFGKILDDWTKNHKPIDKDALEEGARETKKTTSISRVAFKKMPVQATLDLHGLHKEEARAAVRSFIRKCAEQGFEKVSIIHGKGNHSVDEQVLLSVVREELERNPYAGKFEFADSRNGGSGATWVRIRNAISRGR